MVLINNSLKNPEIAEILGNFIGDGWIESTKDALYIAGSQTEDKEHYDTFVAPTFSKYFTKVSPKNFPYWHVYGIVSYKKKIVQKAIDLGFQVGKKSYIAKIPDWIMDSNNKDIIKSVIRGIFDTDGCFYCKKAYGKYDKPWTKEHHCKPRIIFNLTSKMLVNQMCFLFSKINIEFKRYARTPKSNPLKNNSKIYTIHINKYNHIERWFKIVKTSNSRHQTRYDVWKKFGYLPPKTSIKQRKKMLSYKLRNKK